MSDELPPDNSPNDNDGDGELNGSTAQETSNNTGKEGCISNMRGFNNESVVALCLGFVFCISAFAFLGWLEGILEKAHVNSSLIFGLILLIFIVGMACLGWLMFEWVGHRNAIVVVCCLVTVLFIVFLIFHKSVYMEGSENPNAAEKVRPYLDPSLLIDSSSGAFVVYHYEIVNTGEATARNIVHQDSGEGMFEVETPLASEILPRELDPNQKMDIRELTDFGWKTNGGYFSKNLVLYYDAISSGMTNHFSKRFSFIGSSDLLKPGAIFHPDSSDSRQRADKSYVEVTNIAAKLIAALRGPANAAETNNVEISFDFIIRFQKPFAGRENYVFDLGKNLTENRMSLYWDSDGNLCFRTIDRKSSPVVIKAIQTKSTIQFGNFCYLACEIEKTNNASFMGIFINRVKIAESGKMGPVIFSSDLSALPCVLGADLSKEHGAAFDLHTFAVYSSPLSAQGRADFLRYFESKVKQSPLKYFAFHGNNWFEKERFGVDDWHNPNTNNAPIFRIE